MATARGAARRLKLAARDASRALRGQSPPDVAPPAAPEVDYDRIAAIVREVAEEVYNRKWTMGYQLRSASAAESARFVLDHIPLHLGKDHYALRRDAVAAAPEGGLFLEFGVWQGSWLRQMAAVRDAPFYGFDSFEGLPEPWSVYEKGFFDLEGRLPEMPANVTLVKGWFDETLPPFLAEHGEPVSFAHIDCDLYSSTKTVLDALAPRMVEGTQLVLDDFMLEPGWQREEHRAFFEFVERERWTFEYTGYSAGFPSTSAAVVLTGRR
jgi:hypothetical protein